MLVNCHVLNNGLNIITDYVAHSNFVVIQIWVKTGSRAENTENNGIAHFLEHMAFKGTSSRSAEDIAVDFDNIGANFNACTGKENTVYYIHVLKECFDKAIEILADIMLNSTFDEKELVREQSVVLEEIAETNDDPGGLLFDKFIETSFPDQPIGRSILGTKETVMSFNRDTLLNFIDRHYHAGNILLIVTGNIEHNRVVDRVAELFDKLPIEKSIICPESANYVDSLEYRENRDLEQVHLILGVNGLDVKDELYYPTQMLSVILGGSMSSRLFQEVREKRGLVYSISSFNISYNDGGIFGIYACATPNNLKEVIEVTFAELKKLKTTVSKLEMERARTQLKSSLLMKVEGVMGRAGYIGKLLQRFGRYIPVEELINEIDSIDIFKLQCAIDKIIDFKKPTLGAIGKLDNLPDYRTIAGMF